MQIGNIMKGASGWDNPSVGRVYDRKGLSPTLNSCTGGGRIQKLGALGGEHQGNLVFDSCGICRCLTATEYKHATKIIRTGQKEC